MESICPLCIEGPANLFCDNGSVIANTTNPESTLKKKHYAIAYHKVREAVVHGNKNSKGRWEN
jgi:hypothetical protein